jgi:hypothetical protein
VDRVPVELRCSNTNRDFSAPICFDGKAQFTGVLERGVTF